MNKLLLIVSLAIVGGVVYFAVNRGSGEPYQRETGFYTPTPVNTKIGSVNGVNLNSFAAEANDSSALSSQDGAATAGSLTTDGQSINSTTDAVNNPIQ